MRNVFRLPTLLTLFGVAAAVLTPVAAAAQQDTLVAGLDTAGMDLAVKPGDNFFDYANGTWLKDTPIPPDRSSYGAGAILAEFTDRRVAELIQETAKQKAPLGSEAQMVGALNR